MLMGSLRHQRWLRVLIFHWGVPYSLRGEGIILIERLMSLLAAQNFKIWRVELVVWGERKSTRLNSITNAHLVCRLLLEKKTETYVIKPTQQAAYKHKRVNEDSRVSCIT